MDEELLQDIKSILEGIEKEGRIFEESSTASRFLDAFDRMNDNLERVNANLQIIQENQSRTDVTLTLLYDRLRQS